MQNYFQAKPNSSINSYDNVWEGGSSSSLGKASWKKKALTCQVSLRQAEEGRDANRAEPRQRGRRSQSYPRKGEQPFLAGASDA